jgi:hypothetical protein
LPEIGGPRNFAEEASAVARGAPIPPIATSLRAHLESTLRFR